VIGGVGVMWTDWANSITIVRNGVAEVSQLEEQDTGLSISVGGGLRAAVVERISVRTEFRVYDSTLMSRSNLGLVRVSAGLSVGW
jgi:opacity protein-like surface antigen